MAIDLNWMEKENIQSRLITDRGQSANKGLNLKFDNYYVRE